MSAREPKADKPATELVESASRVPGSGYSLEDVERGLHAVALASGNTRRAARELERRGTPIPRGTLRTWVERTHADRYRQIQQEVLPVVYERIAEENEGIKPALLETIDSTAVEEPAVDGGE